MPHQCVRCSKLYGDGATEIITGCTCGAKLFYYVRKEHVDNIKVDKATKELSVDDKLKIEEEIYDIIGGEVDRNIPIILDIESVKVTRPGSFELDLVNLFNKRQPLVYRLEEGKYVVDLVGSLYRAKGKKKGGKKSPKPTARAASDEFEPGDGEEESESEKKE